MKNFQIDEYTIETYESEYGWGYYINRNGILYEGCEADVYEDEGEAIRAAVNWLKDKGLEAA